MIRFSQMISDGQGLPHHIHNSKLEKGARQYYIFHSQGPWRYSSGFSCERGHNIFNLLHAVSTPEKYILELFSICELILIEIELF